MTGGAREDQWGRVEIVALRLNRPTAGPFPRARSIFDPSYEKRGSGLHLGFFSGLICNVTFVTPYK